MLNPSSHCLVIYRIQLYLITTATFVSNGFSPLRDESYSVFPMLTTNSPFLGLTYIFCSFDTFLSFSYLPILLLVHILICVYDFYQVLVQISLDHFSNVTFESNVFAIITELLMLTEFWYQWFFHKCLPFNAALYYFHFCTVRNEPFVLIHSRPITLVFVLTDHENICVLLSCFDGIWISLGMY